MNYRSNHVYHLIKHFDDSLEIKKTFRRKDELTNSEMDDILSRYSWKYGSNIELVKRIAGAWKGP